MFYTAFPGLSAGIMYGVPPYGYNYLSPAPPLFATPFINAGDGAQNTDPFPLNFPPHNVSAPESLHRIQFRGRDPDQRRPLLLLPQQRPLHRKLHVFASSARSRSNALLTVSYAGNQGHHLLVLVPANPGNPALCLSLSQPERGGSGKLHLRTFRRRCRLHVRRRAKCYQGTRVGLGPDYGSVTAQKTVGNSNYNALEATFRMHLGKRATLLVGYTYSKSIDEASNLGEQTNPFNERLTRVISSWDMTHNFVATYTYALPFDNLAGSVYEGGASPELRASAPDFP